MKRSSFVAVTLFGAAFALASTPSPAQTRRQPASPRSGASTARHAVPRVGPPPARVVSSGRRVYPVYPGYRGRYYRPYSYYPYYGYPYRSSVHVGIGVGLGYPAAYSYGAWGFPYRYQPYAYRPVYAYPAYPAYYGPYGGVHIKDAPSDAEVFVDGYYVGIVDDFDNAFQQLTLEAGAHNIEIRAPNAPPLTFDVNVLPGQTITYRAPRP